MAEVGEVLKCSNDDGHLMTVNFLVLIEGVEAYTK